MSTSRANSRALSRLAQSWGVLTLVLAGLFAMHGLGTHGTHSGHTEPAAERVNTVMPATDHTGHVAPGGASESTTTRPMAEMTAALTAGATAVMAAGDIGSAPGAALGLCLAILTALVAFALALRRRGRLLTVVPAPGPQGACAWAGRDPDPPQRAALSVWRC
jgi:hypothetical protein